MTGRVSSQRFVGREPQLAELTRAYADATAGRAWLALVGGESGVGKTRLVDELAAHARERGARVLAGDCLELAEGELPYAPVIGALRPLIRADDPALAELRAELGRPPADASTQGPFFELLLAALDRLGADAPLLLILEDLHWADRSTRDFLAFLARNVCRERALVVGTYRSDELVRRHPLRQLLPELERLDRTLHVQLDRLTRAELADQLAGILGAAPSPALVDRLYARCEGNPLFAEELLAAGQDGKGELPPTLRDALTVRVEALSEPTQELLRVVAAAARADEALLEEVSGLDRTTLRGALREALAHQVLVTVDDGRYAYRHALLREAMHDELLPGEDVELHQALARALDERAADPEQADLDTVTAIAHHYAAAGEQPAALVASIRAAGAAERVHAPAEEAAQLERALSLWPQVPDAEQRAGLDHARLLERLGIACERLGNPERAVHVFAKALAETGEGAPAHRRARLHERLGASQWNCGRSAEALDQYERGLALLADEPEPSTERALLLAAKAQSLMLAGVYSDAERWAERALEAARAAGARGAEASALNSLGCARGGLGDVEGGIACLQRSIDLSWAIDRLDHVGRGYINLADLLLGNGRAQEALLVGMNGLAQLEPRGRRPQWLMLQVAEIAIAAGDWEQARETLARQRAPRFVGTTAVYYEAVCADLELAVGDHPHAIEHLERARVLAAESIDPQWHAPIASLLAEGLRRADRFDDARRLVDETYERLAQVPRMQDHARMARLAAAALAVEADVAQRARDLTDPDSEANALARTHTWLTRARAALEAGTGGTEPWVALAEAEATRAAGVPEPGAWAAAAEAWDAYERPYLAAVARWREAEALAGDGERTGAQATARSAHAVACGLGSSWLCAEIEALARRARLRLDGPPGPAEGEDEELAGDPAAQLGLTLREREVLELLALGRTNREIGASLFMAEKTASVHVSRILAKLDVRSRTEAAAVAHRLGIGR